jgi:2-keto-4-pentenoate hydratase/2-oxohepta-3-ene-1,7-dioic acid hydratase in catechol pathway
LIIVHYKLPCGSAYGLLIGNIVYELAEQTIFGALRRGALVGSINALELLPPVQPGKIIALGRNYAGHAQEHGADIPTQPLIFLKAPSSVIGPGQPIVLPALAQRVEHEAELALVIGQQCRAVSETEAWTMVLGVTCANDVTARDLQRSDGQWARAKSFDTFCPLGPYVATDLSLGQVHALDIACRVNGQARQRGNTAEMVFKIPYLIAYISAGMTLYPGDIILTGTPAGVGPLQAGDTVEVEIDQIGVLRNSVVASSR